jgi:hypothetical protein
MCDLSDAPVFAASLSQIIFLLIRFQFFVFFCHAINKIIRRLLR